MIIYHGANTIVKEIDLNLCRPFKDFGKGFYCTTMMEQAELMAERVAERYGGKPVVNKYELHDSIFLDNKMKIKKFDNVSKEWALFIINNRNRRQCNNFEGEHNFDYKYDLVIGPVADDDLTLLFRNFRKGWIDLDKLTEEMEYKKFSDQYSFHTKEALGYLSCIV